jgi:hypothetical protein
MNIKFNWHLLEEDLGSAIFIITVLGGIFALVFLPPTVLGLYFKNPLYTLVALPWGLLLYAIFWAYCRYVSSVNGA